MKKRIIVHKPVVGCYGNEYKVTYWNGNNVVYSSVLFEDDLEYLHESAPKGFDDARIVRRD